MVPTSYYAEASHFWEVAVLTPHRTRLRFAFIAIAAALTTAVGTGVVVAGAQARREFEVSARKYSFDVSGASNAEIRVSQDDLVHITFRSEDIPHSFTIEESPYRIMRRVERDKPVSFDFRADQPGRFRFFCSLTTDPKCKEMHGTLIVDKK